MKKAVFLSVLIGGWLNSACSHPVHTDFSHQIKSHSMDSAEIMNGFKLDSLRIPMDEIHQGGPPKDGIPSIDHPKFTNSAEADFLNDDDEVLAIVKNGIAKAYPIRILNYHEVVNDQFDQEPVVITFCPLCGSGVAFSGMINGKASTFGVSGLLYNSDVLLYDRNTESLWSQLIGKAISGTSVDTPLELIAIEQTTWGNWKSRHPNTLVLSTETGHSRDYSRLPYAGYEDNSLLYFPVKTNSDLFPKKERVIGISIDGVHKAYAFSRLKKNVQFPIKDELNGHRILVTYDAKNESARITDSEGNLLPATTLFWFAWYAFHPDTQVY